MITSPGRFLIEQALPEKYRNFSGALDGKQVKSLFTQMAKELPPDEYKQRLKRLNNIGNIIATEYGGVASIHLSDLKLPDNLRMMREALNKKIYKIQQDRTLSAADKKQLIIKTVRDATPEIDKEVLNTLGKQENSFGLQVATGVRGKPQQLRQLVFGDLLSLDSKMREVPVPTLRSYGEGITPLQYWVASHGGRQGYIGVQKATADAGYFAKQVRGAAHRQIITMSDCGSAKPYTVDTDDDDNIGSLLYADTKGKSGKVYTANTPITAAMLSDLPDKIKIRSAVTCGTHEGVCSMCSGIRETNTLPTVGESVGMNAVNAFLEGLTQSGLCLSADTEVRMADLSTKRIVDIKPGDLVLAADKTGKTFPTPVVALHNNGEQELYRFTTKIGQRADYREIICTKNHKCLLFRYHSNCKDAKKINNTRVIDTIYTDNNKTYLILQNGTKADARICTVSNKYALLIGLLLGDGGYTKAVQQVHLSCADEQLLADIAPYLQELGMYTRKTGTAYWYSISSTATAGEGRDSKGRFIANGFSNPIKKELQRLGMYGKYAHEKDIPDECKYLWDDESVVQLISGLWATDGSIYMPTAGKTAAASLNLTSRKLLEDVKWLLEVRFGIYASPIYVNEHIGKKRRPLYKLCISDGIELIKLLRMLRMPGKKQQCADKFLVVTQQAIADYTPFHVTTRACVKDMQYVGVQTAYDIEIDTPDHLFVLANGMIVSNSSKHQGGEAVGTRRIKHGLDAVDQFINMPEEFVGGATIAEKDGLVQDIRTAPQGGMFIYVGDTAHHVPADATITVKKGEYIEAGDLLSDGMPNMRKIVRHKGIGEGRRIFVKAMSDVLKAANSSVIRKNVETFARGYVNKVRITDPDGVQGWLIDDLADYNALAANWKPRDGYKTTATKASIGRYLEMPTLHYSIGTRITKRVADDLEKAGITNIETHETPPPFEPTMVSAKQFVTIDDDFLTALSGENLMRSIEAHTQHGSDTEKNSTSYYPRITFMSGGGANSLRVS